MNRQNDNSATADTEQLAFWIFLPCGRLLLRV
jgi:hypothetical protein